MQPKHVSQGLINRGSGTITPSENLSGHSKRKSLPRGSVWRPLLNTTDLTPGVEAHLEARP